MEAKPLVYICRNCRYSYVLGIESTLQLYFMHSVVNHVETTCPKCHRFHKVWQVSEVMVNQILKFNQPTVNPVGVNFEYQASKRTWHHYFVATGHPYGRLDKLSAAEQRSIENQCAMFGYLLEREPPPSS